MSLFEKLDTDELKELSDNFESQFTEMASRSRMYPPEALKLICMSIGREVIEYRAKEVEIRIREAGIEDNLVNYLDTAIRYLSDQYYGAD